jgi:PAS domain S-box-containing protein
VEVSLKRVRISGINRLLAIVRDVSKRVQVQQELQKEKDLAQKYLDVAATMFVGIDTEEKVFLANKRSCEVLGYEQGDIIGKNWFDKFIPQRLREEIKSVSARVLAGQLEPLEYFENPVLTSAGAERIIAWHNTTLRNEQGTIIGHISSGQDITERKQAEEQLRFMQFAVEHIADPAFWMGPDARFTYVNEAACHSLGYTRQELLSMTVHDIDPDFGPEVWPDHWREAKERGSFTIESHHRTKDGRVFPVEIRINFLAYGDKEYNCAFVHDITDRKQAEQERKRLMQALEARTKELQSIVYTASHDLQTPLVTVQGFGGELTKYCEQLVKLAGKKSTDKEVRQKIVSLLKEDIPEALKFINAGADKMRSLLEGLMRLSRIGTAAIELKPIDMKELITDVTRAMKFQIQDKDVSVTIGKLPACLGDVSQIDQVFTNLLDNALKYLEPDRKGKIDISGRIENDMSIYCVRDNGVGVASEHQEQIFEIFYRLEPSGPAAGEGLGLTIIRRILDRHNGRIWVESEIGKGSCFFVSLPHSKLQESTNRKRK